MRRYNPCGHQKTVDGCKECKKWDTLPLYRQFWSKPGGNVGMTAERVSLCVHYIDGKPIIGKADNKTWRLCEPTGKAVCTCLDCTQGCQHYQTD